MKGTIRRWVRKYRIGRIALAVLLTSAGAEAQVATQSCVAYRSPGTVEVNCAFAYPTNRALLSLLWRPNLPVGWTLGRANGNGVHQTNGADIVFTETLTNNPIAFTYEVIVPPDQIGTQAVRGTVEYWLDGMANESVVSADPDPLTVVQRLALVVQSARGATLPPTGTNWLNYGSTVACGVAESPLVVGATQYLCTGWTGSGSLGTGTGTATTVSLTNDSTLTWSWQTQYRLEITNAQGGDVVEPGGWCAAGSLHSLHAVPTNGYEFAGWQGDVPTGQTNTNPLTLTMDRPRNVMAVFTLAKVAPAIDNLPVTGVTSYSATLRGNVLSLGWPTSVTVRICYGTSDGGTNVSAWSRNTTVGTRPLGSFSWGVGGLTSNAAHYFRCFASNAGGVAWAPTSAIFTTLPPPVLSISTNAVTVIVPRGQASVSNAFEVWNGGPGSMFYSLSDNAAWLSVAPASGSSTGEHDRISAFYALTNLAPGGYSAQITVSGSYAVNSPQTVNAYLTVLDGAPVLQASPTSLALFVTAPTGEVSAAIRVWNGGPGSMAYTVSNSVPWCQVAPAGGISTGQQDIVTVTVAAVGLAAGVYSGTVWFVSADVTNSPLGVPIAMTVLQPAAIENAGASNVTQSAATLHGRVLTAGSSTSCLVRVYYGKTNGVTDPGGWSTWASLGNRTTGVCSYAASSLTPDTLYYYRYWASNLAGVAWAGEGACFTTPPPTVLALSTTALTQTVTRGSTPLPDAFDVWNAGPGRMDYTISDDVAWLTVAPSAGFSTGEQDHVTVQYASTNLSPGLYEGHINVLAATATNTPQVITSYLTILSGLPSIQLDLTNIVRTVYSTTSSVAMTFRVWNGGDGVMGYTLSNAASWCEISPNAGLSTGQQDQVTLTVRPQDLGVGVVTTQVWIVSPDATNSPRSVTLTVNVVPPPVVMLSTSLLTRTCVEGTAAAASSFQVWNGGYGGMAFSVTDDVDWAWESPATGSSTGDSRYVYANYVTTNLAAGLYTGHVSISSAQATNLAATVTLLLTVTPRPRLVVDPLLITNSFIVGATAASRSFRVWNGGSGSFSYAATDDVAWLSVTPSAGVCTTGTGMPAVVFNTAGLSAGTHTGRVTVTAGSAADSPQTLMVLLQAVALEPALGAAPTSFSVTVTQDQPPLQTNLVVWNTARMGAMIYTLSDGPPWLTALPTSGMSTGEQDQVALVFDPTGLATGQYSGSVTVTSPEATNSPIQLGVSMKVVPAPRLWVNTNALAWVLHEGESATNTVTVRNVGGGRLDYAAGVDVNWATAAPAGGTSTGEIDTLQVVVQSTGRPIGTDQGVLTVSSPQDTTTAGRVVLTLTVRDRPLVAASPATMAVSTVQGSNAPPALIDVWNAHEGDAMAYHLSANVSWLAVTPADGVSTGEHDSVQALFQTAGLAPGSYTGAVTVLGGAANSPIVLTVILTVAPQPAVLARLPERLSERIVCGATAGFERAVEVWNDGQSTGLMTYAISTDVPWLTVVPDVGMSRGQHNLHSACFTNLEGLAEGLHTGRILIVSADAANSPQSIAVELTVDSAPPVLQVTPGAFVVTNIQGGGVAPLVVEAWNGGTTNPLMCRASSTVPWLLVEPSAAMSVGGTHAVFTNRLELSGLPPGEYEGVVMVSGDGAAASPQGVVVHVTVRPQPSVIALSPETLAATVYAGDASVTQRLWVWNAGTGTMSYAVSTEASWLSVTPGSETASGALRRAHTLVMQGAGLAEGVHTGAVVVTAPGANNSPRRIDALLTVWPEFRAAPAVLVTATGPGTNPLSQVVEVWNAGSANPVPYTVISRSPWLSATPSDGVSSGQVDSITVACDVTGLASGVYEGALDVVPTAWTSAYERILVRLVIAAPRGRFAEKIVFDSSRSGNSDIWMVNPDGSGLTALVVRAGYQYEPRISPDGLKLAYRDATVAQLIVLDLATGTERAFMNLYGYDWLPDSSGLVGHNTSGPDADLWRISLAGAATLLLVESDRQTMLGVDRLSGCLYYTTDPGGTSNTELKVYDPAAGTRAVVLPRDGGWRGQGNVSHDGRWLCYPKLGSGQSVPAVHMARADGSDERCAVAPAGVPDSLPDFSPDGTGLVFARSNTLFTTGAGGISNVPSRLGAFTGSCGAPAWGVLFLRDPDRPLIGVEPQLVTHSMKLGDQMAADALAVWNAGSGLLSYTISNVPPWLMVSPVSGVSTGEVDTVRLDYRADGLAVGSYTGVVNVIAGAASNSPLRVTIRLEVRPPDGVLSYAPSVLSNVVVQGGAADTQHLAIRNVGGGTLNYTLASDAAWLTVTPAAGTSTGETDTIDVLYDAGGMPPGTTNATLTLTVADSTNVPVTIPVSLTVVAPLIDPPVLAVAPTMLATSLVQGAMAEQVVEVWNAGATVLVYTVSNSASWLSATPISGSSQGERDRIGVTFRTTGLATGLYSAAMLVCTPVGTQSVSATLTVLPPPRYRLNIVTNPPGAGWVSLVPAQPADGYAAGTSVTLWSYAYSGYQFTHWSGAAFGTNRSVNVVMDDGKTVAANFLPLTVFRGYVTNAVTRAGIAGARVEFGTNVAVTSLSGYYSLTVATCEGAVLRLGRTGYVTREEDFAPPCFTTTVKSVGLTPCFVSNTRAAQRPGTRLVDITYDFDAPTNDIPVVAVSISSQGGVTWDVRAVALAGDLGTNVARGVGRRIVWDAGADAAGIVSSQMVVRVGAGGSYAASPAFAMNTREAGEWSARVWNDFNRNGRYDPGEGVPGAEVYYDGRLAAHIVGVTDTNGILRVFHPLQEGRIVFARKAVYQRLTPKGQHTSVSNVLYTLWQDSDLGGSDSNAWDGTWRSAVVSADDVRLSELGAPLYLEARHSVFEWNLTVAAESASTEFAGLLGEGLEQASLYLYDVTDGQMKLGAVAVSTGVARASTAWSNADVVVYAQNELPPTAPNSGVNSSLGGSFRMGATWKGAAPNQPAWFRTWVRQFCVYAFGFYSEDADGRGSTAAWQTYRLANPDKVPANYGVMDNAVSASELSARHHYLPAYSASTDASRVTMQVYNRSLRTSATFYPCWQWLEASFQRAYGRVFAELTTPVPGYYLGYGQSTSEDRPGPYGVPSPYLTCLLRGIPRTNETASAGPVEWLGGPATSGRMTLRVTRNAMPQAGASIWRHAAGGGWDEVGVTDARGELTTYALTTGDSLKIADRGRVIERTVAMGGGMMAVELHAPTAGTETATTLTSGEWGSAAAYRLAAEGRSLHVVLWASRGLDAPPAVRALFDDGSECEVAMMPADDNSYAGDLALGDASAGVLDISCTADGDTLRTLDRFDVDSFASEGGSVYSRAGHAELRSGADVFEAETRAVVIEDGLPATLPDSSPRARQVLPQIAVALADGAAPRGSNMTLNLTYDDDDVAGLDESSLRLYAWDPSAMKWATVPFSLATEGNIVSAPLGGSGVYALFADSTEDGEAPERVADLVAASGDQPWSVRLTWTAPGDDGNVGQAAAYVLKYASSPLTNWNDAPSYPLHLTPAPAGQTEAVTLAMPDPNTLYYFRLAAQDEAGNLALPSNESAGRSQYADENRNGIPDQVEVRAGGQDGAALDPNADPDGDGLTTGQEYACGTDPLLWDTDGDGMGDKWELDYGLNPLVGEDASLDPDQDGLANVDEYRFGTDPHQRDSDGDGLPDGWEAAHGLNAISISGTSGSDADPDGDGFINAAEYTADTNPSDPLSYLKITAAVQAAEGTSIQFPSSSSRWYDLLVTTDPVSGIWNRLISSQAGALAGTTFLTDTNADAAPRFYRIEVRLPMP